MNPLHLALGLALTSLSTLLAQPFRDVSGRTVDLAPLRTWMQSKKGQRPMPHWRCLRIVDVTPRVDGAHRVKFVDLETENEGTVRMSNVPKSLIEAFKEIQRLRQLAGVADAAVARTDAAATYADGRASDAWAVSGSRDYVAAVANQERLLQDEAASRRAIAELTKAQRAALKARLEAREQEVAKVTEFAMFTGRLLGEEQLWDCGCPTASGAPTALTRQTNSIKTTP